VSMAAFRHEALFYASDAEFLDGTLRFVREGLEAGEPILVVVDGGKLTRLRDALGADAGEVGFADMAQVGTNPARIIPAWRQFVDERAAPGRGVRGIGEPIWPERTAAELAECHRHESLLNLAFAEDPGFHLLCPYDTSALEPEVVEAAAGTHPLIREEGEGRLSRSWSGLNPIAAPFGEPLPEPPVPPRELAFGPGSLHGVREFVTACASGAGLGTATLGDLLLAATEIASNSVRHAGGKGVMRVWRQDDGVICEVRDEGQIAQPLAGRVRPYDGQIGGYGLWLANQLCDLVQVRAFPTGGVVRLHMRPR
jgi:anti-sigma regulatory factor (Ser/Thr protein kinase)